MIVLITAPYDSCFRVLRSFVDIGDARMIVCFRRQRHGVKDMFVSTITTSLHFNG
jgi:hypothetical protein